MIIRHIQQLFLVLILGAGITVLSSILLRTSTPLVHYVVIVPTPPQTNTATAVAAIPEQVSTDITPTETSRSTTAHAQTIVTKKTITKVTTPKIPPQQLAPTELSDTAYMAAVEQLINLQTNTYRTGNNHAPLISDPDLTRNTTQYSNTLLAGDFLSHTDKKGCDMSCRFTRDGYTKATAWGENLGVLRFENRPTPEYVANYFIQAWKKSADHKANLLSANYTNTGIGVAMNTHSLYITVQFARPK